MGRLPDWMPTLLRKINWGCSTSTVLAPQNDTAEAFESGRTICKELYPFIQELPGNIAGVRDALPPDMTAAFKLLSDLSDEERVYQQLFIKQCKLARLNVEELASKKPSPTTERLCEVMRAYCTNGNYLDGILAIVAAELTATAFCRAALPHFEKYFQEHRSSYSDVELEEGLEWLNLHTQPNTQHALWMKRMLSELEIESTKDGMPEPLETVLGTVFAFLQCPESGPPASKKDLSLARQTH